MTASQMGFPDPAFGEGEETISIEGLTAAGMIRMTKHGPGFY